MTRTAGSPSNKPHSSLMRAFHGTSSDLASSIEGLPAHRRLKIATGKALASLLFILLIFPSACTLEMDPAREGFPCNPDGACDYGLVCAAGICIEDRCPEMSCDEGEICINSACHARYCEHRFCPHDHICVDGDCVSSSCAGVTCEDGEKCADGECYPADCDNIDCGTFVCIDDECVERSCVGVSCEDGEACALGRCYPADCATPCRTGEVCVDGDCVETACVGVSCPNWTTCVGGICEDVCGVDPPVAIAGADQTVSPGAEVTLDGSSSFAINGEIKSWTWTQTAGTSVTLTGADTPQAIFQAPTSTGDLAFALVVTDECDLMSLEDQVMVHVRVLEPVAVIEAPASVDETAIIELDGSGSHDPNDMEIVSWQWSAVWPEGEIDLDDTDQSTAKLTAPSIAGQVEPIVVTLMVTNEVGATDSASVEIAINDVINNPPVADAGPDQTVAELAGVTLDAGSSFDPNNDPLSFTWQQDMSDGGPEVTLAGSETATPSFQAPRVAETIELTFDLTVDDGRGLTDTDSVVVTVQKTIVDLAFVTNPPATIEAGETFSLTVEVRDTGGVRAAGAADEISLHLLGDDEAELSGTTTRLAADGVAVFGGLFVSRPTNGVRIEARSELLSSDTTTQFDVLPGATNLTITSSPATAMTGETFEIVAEARDDEGNLAVGYSATVSIAVTSGPSGSTLAGTLSVGASAGIASFSNLWLDRPGIYTLEVSSGTLDSDSTTMDISVAPPAQIVFDSDPHTVTAGECSGQVILETRDDLGNPSPVDANLTIALSSGSSTLDTFVDVSCINGTDAGNLILPAGSSTVAFYFVDTTAGSPAITADPTGLPSASQTQTIQAAPASTLVIVEQPPEIIGAGQTFEVVIEAQDQHGNLDDGFTGTVSIDMHPEFNPGDAELLGTTSRNASSGVATFPGLSIEQDGTGYRLYAQASGFLSAASDLFDVVITATRLVVTVQPPGEVPLGSSFTVSVEAQNEMGHLDASFEENVEITIQSPPSPSAATLTGSTSLTASGGQATFTNLRIDRTGTTFVLRVQDSSGSLTPGETDTFTVRPFEGGSGTLASPYLIANVLQLQQMNNHRTSHFALDGDIDASATEDWNNSAGFLPIGTSVSPFSGTLDGQGHIVFDLHINRATLSDLGLFRAAAGAEISDICLKDVYVRGNARVGAIVGQSTSGTLIARSCATGEVIASGDDAGGLVGNNDDNATVEDSYARVDVSGAQRVGGLVGYQRGTIRRSYSTGTVSGSGHVGGLTGREIAHGSTFDSFWDTQSSGTSTSGSGTGKTTAQMKDAQTYTNTATSGLSSPWDFTTIWDIDDTETYAEGYPFLRAVFD